MSQGSLPTEPSTRLPTRRYTQLRGDDCSWANDLPMGIKQRSKSISCLPSSVLNDQKGNHRYTSSSADNLKKYPSTGSVFKVLEINEPLMNVINKEQGDSAEPLGCKLITKKCESVVRTEDSAKLMGDGGQRKSLQVESDNKLVNRALELAQSLFGPDATIVKTFQATPIQCGLSFEENIGQIARLETSKESGKDLKGMKADESANYEADPPSVSKNRAISSALNAQASLLNRTDFTALEVLNEIYRDAPVGGTRFVKPTSTTFSYLPQHANARTQLKTKALASASTESEQSTLEREQEILRQRQRDLMDEYFHRSSESRHTKGTSGRQGQVLADQKYYEYYEYLCKGIKRASSYAGSFNSDCGAGNVHTPSNQQVNGKCLAMKSNLYYQYNPGPEIYSKKVFVGGLPIDIDEDELTATFSRFGPLVVDWPNKSENKSYFPPKGYVFLIFEYEASVRALVQSCFVEDEKLFLYISSPLSPDKLVQIRPWRLADADYVVETSIPLYGRRTVFVGGVPRPIKAVELAHIMDRLYGSVGCAGIDTDVEYKYPKGAGRVAFTDQNSYMRAITDRYVQLSHGEIEKRVELKPYVLDDQPCDECGGERCGHRHAPFFCPEFTCLQYYCEKCWTSIHRCRARENHKPLVKEA